MTPLAKIAAALVFVTAAAGAVPADGDAAKRRVPNGFVGATWDGPIRAAPDAVQRAQFPRMARAGVETLRVGFHWQDLQHEQGGPFDLSSTDRLVEAASARRIRVFPHIIIAPPWNRWDLSNQPLAPPSDPEEMRPLMKALIERYGRRGSFWDEHPELPRLPIRHWQFWNEPHLTYQWTIPDNVSWHDTYEWELRSFYTAVKENDPGAKVVLAGLSNESWIYLKRLYGEGARGLFDIAAVHPYTQRPSGVVEIVRRFRRVMRRHGDGRKPIWVTEVGLPASRGRTRSKSKLQTTSRGQARFLRKTYKALARARRKRATRVRRVYWYTWASEYRGNIFRWTGLFKYAGRGEPVKRRGFRAYVRTARRLQGCRKDATGRCR